MENEVGYVYILTNPSFKDDWIKIGKSSRPVDVRSKELDNTSTPLPFEIYATMQTKRYNEVENRMHKMIDRLSNLRIRSNREFFNIKPEVALDLFRDIADLIDNEIITVYKNGEPYFTETDGVINYIDQENKPAIHEEKTQEGKQARFKFSMIGLKSGDIIEFTPTGTIVEVYDDSKIVYEGETYTTSSFCAKFMPVKTESNSWQGPKYFNVNGVSLLEMRNKLNN